MKKVLVVKVLLFLLAHSAFATRRYPFGRRGRHGRHTDLEPGDEPLPVIDPSTLSPVTGEHAVLTCSVSDPEDKISEIRWGYQTVDGPLPEGIKVETEDDKTQSTLVIESPKERHAGKYYCTARNDYGERSSDPATVRKPISLSLPVINPSTLSPVTGEQAVLTCSVSDTEDEILEFRWGYQTVDGPLPEGVKVETKDDNTQSMLIFEPVNEHHAGNYYCTARSNYGERSSDKAAVEVLKPPTAVMEPGKWTGEPGTSFRFRCVTTGTPAPKITFSVPGGELAHDVRGFDNGTLHFKKGRRALNGTYTCTAENAYGTACATAKVDIGPGMEIVFNPPGPKITLLPGQPLTVRGDAIVPEGDPEPKVKWTGGPPATDDFIDFTPVIMSGHFLTHPGIHTLNAGTYLFQGDNGLIKREKELEIEVLQPIAILGGSKQWFHPKSKAELFCLVIGSSPLDTFEWRKNGKELPPGDIDYYVEAGVLHFPEFQPKHEGEYKCLIFRDEQRIANQRVHVYAEGGGPVSASRVEIEGPLVQAVQQGDSFSLTCTVNGGSDGVKFSWALFRPANLVPLQSEGNKLKIVSADPFNDSGIYRCTAKEDEGGELGYAFVAVTVGYSQESQIVQEFDEGLDATLECPVFAAPDAHFSWEKMDGKKPEDAKASENNLSIPKFDSAKEGVYICSVKYGTETIRGFVKAQIRKVEKLTIVAAPELPVDGGQTYFDCKMSEGETTDVTWSKVGEGKLPDNAQVSGTKLQFVNVRENNAGTYKCSVTTTEGKVLEALTEMNMNSSDESGPVHKRRHPSDNQKTNKNFTVVPAKGLRLHQSIFLHILNFLVLLFTSFLSN